MMAFWIFVIIIGVLVLAFPIITSGDKDSVLVGMVGGMIILLGLIGFGDSIKPSPKAIDVYRGKTELKITGTYKDSIFIPTDSTVIFKRM